MTIMFRKYILHTFENVHHSLGRYQKNTYLPSNRIPFYGVNPNYIIKKTLFEKENYKTIVYMELIVPKPVVFKRFEVFK